MESKSRSPEEQKLIDAKIAAIKKKEALIKKRQLEIEEDKRLAEAQDAVVNLKPNINDWLPDKTPPLRPSNRVSFGEVEEMNPTLKENPFRGRGRGKREDKQIYQKVGGPPPDPVSFLADPDRDLPAEPPNNHYQSRNRQDVPPKNYDENWRGEEKWSPPKAAKNEGDWRGERQKNVDRNWRGDVSGDANSDERNASIKSNYMQQDWRKAEAVPQGKTTHHASSPSESHSIRDDRDVRSDVNAKNIISHSHSVPERETNDLRQRLVSKRHNVKAPVHSAASSQEDSWNSRDNFSSLPSKQLAQIPSNPIQKTTFNTLLNQTGQESQSSQEVYESNFQQAQNAAYYSNSKPKSNYEAQRVIREIHQAYQLESDEDWEGNVECVTNQLRMDYNQDTRTAQLNAAAWAQYNDCENDPNPINNYNDPSKSQMINRSMQPQSFISTENQFWNETANTQITHSTDLEAQNSHPDRHHWNEPKSTAHSNLGPSPLHYEQVHENQQVRLAYPPKQSSPACPPVLESRNPHSDRQNWNEPKSATSHSNSGQHPIHYEQMHENQQARLVYPHNQPSPARPSVLESRNPHSDRQNWNEPKSATPQLNSGQNPTHYKQVHENQQVRLAYPPKQPCPAYPSVSESRNSHPDYQNWNEPKSATPHSNSGQNPMHYEQMHENQQARLAYPPNQSGSTCPPVLESRNPHPDCQNWNEPKSMTPPSNSGQNPTHYEQVYENQQVGLAYPPKQPSSACPSNYDSRQISHGQHPVAPGSSHQKFIDDPSACSVPATHYSSNNPQIQHHTPTQSQMEELQRQLAYMYQSSARDQRIITSERSNAVPANHFQDSDSHGRNRQSQVHATESKNWSQPQDDLRAAALHDQTKAGSINERLKRSQEQALRAAQHAFNAQNPTPAAVAQFVYSQTEGLRQIGKDFQDDLSAGAIQKGAEIACQIERRSRTQNYPCEVEARQNTFSVAQRSLSAASYNPTPNLPNNYSMSNTCVPTADGFANTNFETFNPNDGLCYDEYSGNLPEKRNPQRNTDCQNLSSNQHMTPCIAVNPQAHGPMTQFNTQRSGSNRISQLPSSVQNVGEYSQHDHAPPNFAGNILESRGVYSDRGSNQSMTPHNIVDAHVRGQMIQSFPQQIASKRLSQPPPSSQPVSEFSQHDLAPSSFTGDNLDGRNVYCGEKRPNESMTSHGIVDAHVPGQMTQFSVQQSSLNRISQHPPTIHDDNDYSQLDNDPSNYANDDSEVRNVYYVDEMYSSENLSLEPPPPAPMKLNMLNDRLKRAQIAALQRGTEVSQQHVHHHGPVAASVNTQRPIGRAIKGCQSQSSSNSPDSKSAESTHFDNWQDSTGKISSQGPDFKNPPLVEPTEQIIPPRSNSAQSHASSNLQSDDTTLPLEITLPTCIDLSKPPPKLFASPAVSPTPEQIPQEIQANIYSAPPPPIPELNPDSADIENLIAKPYHQYKPPSNQAFRPKLTFSLEKKGLERAENQSHSADEFLSNQVDQSTRNEDGFSQNSRNSTKNSKAFQTNKETVVEKRITAAERVAKLLETPPVLPDYTPSYVLKVLGEEEIRNIKSRTTNGRSSQDVGSQ